MANFEQYNKYPVLTPVRVVSASNVSGVYSNGPSNNGVGATLTISASSLTVDSVSLNVGDRLLLAAQTSAFQNGIYVVNSIGSTVVLQRSGDLQSIEQVNSGFFVSVAAGTVYNGSIYTMVEPKPAAFGINSLVLVNVGSESSGTFLPLAGGTMTGQIVADKGTGTVSAGAVTINHQAGVITTTSLTTAAGSSATVTLNDSDITSSSVILVSLMGGTNTTIGIQLSCAYTSAGVATLTISNNNASAALNGTLFIGFCVL